MASVSFGAVTSIPILLKPLADDLGWSRSAVSMGHTLAMFGAGIGSLFMGRWLDRHGFFRIALAGAVATGAGLLMAGAATGMWQLYCSYGLLIGGVGQAVFFGPLAAATSLWFERHRALAISIAASGQSFGGLIAPPLLRYGADQIGWREVLQMYGLFAAATLTIGSFAFLRKPSSRQPSGTVNASNRGLVPAGDQPVRQRNFRFLAAALMLSNFANFVVMGHVTAFGEEMGMASVEAAGILAVLLGTTLVSRLGWGYLVRRFSEFGILVSVTFVHMSGIALLALAGSQFGLSVAAALIGLGFGAYLPGYAVIVREMFPVEQAGRRIAEIYFFGFIAAGIGTWSGGFLYDRFGGYQMAFLSAVIGSALAPWVLLSLGGLSQRPR